MKKNKITKNAEYKYRLFCKNLIKFKGDQRRAYMETYPDCSKTSASVSASQLMAKPEVKLMARQALDNAGVDISTLSKRLYEKLNCKKPLVVANEIHWIDDNQSQNKAIELGYKVHGALTDNDNSVNNLTYNQTNNQVNIISSMSDRFNKVASMLEALNDTKVSSDDGVIDDVEYKTSD